ncbi:S41 family peptidase [Chitinophaga horti]|uniref:S41 family peptidase n=1 Tax=Chitinophaga horti TaxID=2920382 RepID=A0ABY6J1F1_9BACT|nr:S41 family peptidase [Chitinophaga horti]UYQ93503.1 S41 family peptidase [Chitinophaga horti]
MKALKIGLCFFLLVAANACKKGGDSKPDGGGGGAPATGTRTQLTLDSIYLYAKEVYLWYEALPSYAEFDPRKYVNESSELANLSRELYGITQLAVNPQTNRSYEYNEYAPAYSKYSYVTNRDGSTNGRMATVSLEERGEDFGFELAAILQNDIRVLYVNPASPAFLAGVVRGDRITAINNTNVTSSSPLLTSAFNGNTMVLTVQKADGSSKTYNLTKAVYTSSPVLKSAVLTGNVGYLALARFSRLSKARAGLDAAFASFAQKGVKKLIIDLRYNGGGYVNTADYLLNLIAPRTLNNKTTYIEYYNDLLRSDKAPILKYQPLYNEDGSLRKLDNGQVATYANVSFSVADNTMKFEKEGPLDGVTHVSFIVSRNTASASELTINALKPYLTVKTVGSKTYGKPVGFFAINIDKYAVYMSSFLIRNSVGFSDYFDGMTPDVPAQDDPRYDFGDPAEDGVKQALAVTTNGRLAPAAPVETRFSPQVSKVENGMIQTFERSKLKD